MTTLLFLSLTTAMAASARSSSVLRDSDGKRHMADLAFDGLMQTSWAAGESGEGSWLELDLGRSIELKTVSLWPGDLSKGARSFREHSRPKRIHVLVDGEQVGDPIRLLDEMKRVDVRLGVTGRRVRVVVDEIFEGYVFRELHISEMAVNFPDTSGQERMDRWLQSAEASRLMEKHYAQVEADYFAHKSAEFGDDDAFARLCAAAADGPAFLASKARAYAPMGYRVQAISSSAKAREALHKLGGSNAIPLLEMAAMRAWGEEQAALSEEVEIFYAYQELIGGPDLNVPYWGQPGWEPGAFQSFGEPLAIEADRDGNLYIADTGNSRVQMFTEDGKPERQWGSSGGADLANAWFDTGRPWYVSGAVPGTGASQFTNPIDVEIIPGKEADGFAVLDATGQVRVFDDAGRLLISWTADVQWPAEPKLGGQGYLAWVPKEEVLVVIIQDQAVVYTLDAEEVGRWEVADGTPNAVEVDKAGKKLLMAFGDAVTLYHTDGFRDRTLIDASTLGIGFESMDLTLDEERKLWILTDSGQAFKFKKPGKLEFSITAFDRPISTPRIAVRDGIIYAMVGDRIERVDALQVKLDEEEAAKAEAGK